MADPATAGRIRERLAGLEPVSIELIDESALHAGHEGAKSGGGHYRLRLVSGQFKGLASIARHRLVYAALADLMKRDIHALSLTLLSPQEAERDAAA